MLLAVTASASSAGRETFPRFCASQCVVKALPHRQGIEFFLKSRDVV